MVLEIGLIAGKKLLHNIIVGLLSLAVPELLLAIKMRIRVEGLLDLIVPSQFRVVGEERGRHVVRMLRGHRLWDSVFWHDDAKKYVFLSVVIKDLVLLNR